MSNVKASVQFSKSIASFTPSPLPIRDGNSPTIDMNFNGLNTVCKSNSERISAISDSIFKVNSIVGSLPLSADPSASIGLASVNGSAVTYMRSDAAPALSQAIVPTWTGVHTFAAQPKISTLTASKPVFTDASKGLVSVNIIGVPFGGTGAASFTANSILYGNGTGAVQELTVQAASTIFFLTQASSGIPDWRTLTASDMAPVSLVGDVTWAYTSALTTTIGANKVTYAKFQQVAASSLVGNASGSLANAAEITLGSTLAFSGSALQTLAMTGDVSSSANSFVTTIGANKVTLAMMATLSPGYLLGRYTDGVGNVEALDATTAKTLLSLDLVQNTALSTWAGSTNITTLGTIGTGTWSGTAIAIAKGGTGQTTAATSFNALSPLTTLGDILYGGTSGAGTRLAGNTASTIKVLCQTGTGTVSAIPAWNAATGTGNVAFSASPTFTGTVSAAVLTLSSTLSVTGTSSLSASVGVGSAPNSSSFFFLRNGTYATSIAFGIDSAPLFTSGVTSSGGAGYFEVRTQATSFTMTSGIGVQIGSPTKGSGSTITTAYGLKIEDQSAGGTNYAIYTGAGLVRFGGSVSLDAALTSAGSSGGYNEGTFTATLTGVNATVTATASYVRIGKMVILRIPFMSGTSNSTTFGISGIPAEIRPSSKRIVVVGVATDNSLSVANFITVTVNTDGTAGFGIAYISAWTASGTKAIGDTGNDQPIGYSI